MDSTNHQQAERYLQQLQRQQRGRLTLFLGAAPGVGKTYAMLNRAHELQRQGADVVVGVVETHGRQDTANLLLGLTKIPLKKLQHQQHVLYEMDIDAILHRHPSMVLVDELAHQNAPSSRHQKRWQDVNELLDAGIDVFSTMNIQHLESLNDVVYQITQIRVRETVPDRVFDRIRDIRLVDLPVNELLERLQQGKVYVQEDAQYALKNFFQMENLTALRELAIQTVAQMVDRDRREQFILKGLQPLAIYNHVLIVIQGKGDSEDMVRIGSRIAERRHAKCTIIAFSHFAPEQDEYYRLVSTNNVRIQPSSVEEREIEKAFQLGRQLGANTAILYGRDSAQAVYDYATTHDISTVVVAQNQHKNLWQKYLKTTLIEKILVKQPEFELSIIPLKFRKKNSAKLQHHYAMNRQEIWLMSYVTILTLAIAYGAKYYLSVDDLSVIFILAVTFIASKTRMFVAMFSAILFSIAYNFVFIPPIFSLHISAQRGFVTVIAFLTAALIAGRLASRLREEILALKAANRYNRAMQDLGQKLSIALDLPQVLATGKTALERYLDVPIFIYLAEQQQLDLDATSLNEKEKISCQWTLKHHQPSGKFTQTLMENAWCFLPILNAKDCLGVVGLNFTHQLQFQTSQKHLVEAMIEYIAQAIARTKLSKALEIANVSAETEKLRSALLSSVSHDLRSPLSAMIGSADTLIHYRQAMAEHDQDSLLQTIRLEGERLNRYIQNLLDMTRLGYQGLELSRGWIGIKELIHAATSRLARYQSDVQFSIQFDIHGAQDINLYVHPALIEQALFNVLENAAKFNPKHIPIILKIKKNDKKHVKIEIQDAGPGIAKQDREKIFDMFYTMQHGDSNPAGTGLGLTIVKAIIAAHGGKIYAESNENQQGTCICIILPIHPIEDEYLADDEL
ncbi:MAG: sensor histidine kinase KdpD [Acinetobacter sp.]